MFITEFLKNIQHITNNIPIEEKILNNKKLEKKIKNDFKIFSHDHHGHYILALDLKK